jgi:hypothetical protein
MTRLITTGFELGDDDLEIDGGGAVINGIARTGNYSRRCTFGSSFYYDFYDAALTELYIGVGLRPQTSYGSYFEFITIAGDQGNEAGVQFLGDTELAKLVIAGGGQQSDPFRGIPKTDQWCYLELYYKLDGSSGEFTAKVDGIQVAQITGDTQNSSSYITKITFKAESSSYYYYDDLIINDTNGSVNNYWTGQPKLALATVNGAGTNTEWSASTGNNYECVDEIPPSTADYTYTPTTSGVYLDTYNITNPLSTTNVINNVVLIHLANVDSGNSIFYPALYVNGSDYVGASGILVEAVKLYQSVWKQNPDTSSDWTYSDITNLEIGQKS